MLNRAAVLASLLLFPAVAARADDESVVPNVLPPGTVTVVAPVAAVAPVVMTAPSATPSSAPAAQPAPQNEDWSNVSHINGQLVKVGERGDYLYKFKKVNISVDPFGPFLGYYEAAISYGLSQNVALSASFGTLVDNSGNTSGYQATLSLPIYFRRTYSGPFLEPGLIVRGSTTNDDYECDGCDSTSTSTSWAGPEMLFGWQWMFDSGLNVAWAAGVVKHLGGDAMGENTDVNGYFRVGYAF
ncbi:MAG TPA: hypothetical protein VGF94_15350 [Kofleriaceae bacterium]|jgi:hypothetical protein